MNETKRSAHWRLQTSKLNWRLQTRKPNSLHGNKWSKAILYLLHLWPLDNGSCRPESVQALEAEQNPRLTAKEMTATQKRYPKQTHASEGAVKFCANHRGRRTLQLEISSSSLRTRIAKPLLEPTSKRSMLKQTVRSDARRRARRRVAMGLELRGAGLLRGAFGSGSPAGPASG